MFQRILTELERASIKQFLRDSKNTPVIRTLKSRANKFIPVIEEDLKLLKSMLEASAT